MKTLIEQLSEQIDYIDELEKEASIKRFLLNSAVIGSTAMGGMGAGSIGGTISGMNQANQGFEIIKQEPKILTSAYLAKYAPGVKFINPDSLKTTPRYNAGLKTFFGDELKKGNSFYQAPSKQFPEAIMAPDSSRPSVIAHEVGHSLERKAHPGFRPG